MSNSDEHRVLLRMQEGEDRRLLGEWLATESEYLPVMAESNDVLSSEFDICITDAATIRDAGPDILSRKRMEPTFLPCLLLVPERVADEPDRALSQLSEDVQKVVDETLAAPIRKEKLRRRLETLLRTRDLSERLQRSRDRYHQLLETMPEAVFVFRDGEIDYVNEAGLDLLGRRELAVVEESLVSFAVDRDRQTVARHLRKIRRGQDIGQFEEATLRTATGATIPVELGGARMFDEDGNPIVQIVVHDLSRQREREQQLAVLDQVLRHSLGTRVDAVLEHLQAVSDHAEEPAVQDHVENIRDVAFDLLELSDDARRFRTLLRQQSAADSARDLAAVVGETVATQNEERDEVDVEMELTSSAPVAPHEAVELAVDELLGNALAKADGTVHVATETTDDVASLRITSTDPGVPISDRYPLESETEDMSGSIDALGLWLVRWSIEEAGGRVEIEADEQAVVVWFPRADVDPETTQPGRSYD